MTTRLQRDADRILLKMAERCRIGWVYFHPDSEDRRTAMARAVRISFRRKGERITLQRARQL